MPRALPLPVAIVLAFALASPSSDAAPAGAGRNFTVSAVAPQAQTEGRRVALVIGNSAYKDAPLTNPGNDARAMAMALEAAGFAVTLRLDTTQRELMNAVRDFGNQLRQGAVGLFYFAGHGMQIKGRNYLIPVGADIQREDEVAYSSLDAQAVLDKMESAGNGSNVMILDACRNNPFARSFRSSAQGLAQMDAPVGTLVAFSTAPGSVASDGQGQHGLYTQHLLEAMRQPGAKLEDVFKQVRAAVRRDSSGKQIPWEATSLEGDFYFHRPAPPNPSQTAPAPDVEQWLWEAVQKQPDALGLRAYLQRFPQGRHAAEARAQLRVLEATAAAPPTTATSTVAAAPEPATAPAGATTTEAEHRLRLQGGRVNSGWAPGPAASPVAFATAPAGAEQAPSSNVDEQLRQQSGRSNPAWADPAVGGAPVARGAAAQAEPGVDLAGAGRRVSPYGFGVGDSWTYGVRDRAAGDRVVAIRSMTLEGFEDASNDSVLQVSVGQRLDAQGRIIEVVEPHRGRAVYAPYLPAWWMYPTAGEKREFEFTETVHPANGSPTVRRRFKATVRFSGVERIVVPAGTFEAQRFVTVAYELRADGTTSPRYRRYSHWFSYEAGREVASESSAYDPEERLGTGERQWQERVELAAFTRVAGPLAAAR